MAENGALQYEVIFGISADADDRSQDLQMFSIKPNAPQDQPSLFDSDSEFVTHHSYDFVGNVIAEDYLVDQQSL